MTRGGLVGALKDLLAAVGTAATNDVLRERLALAATEAEHLEKEKTRLQARMTQLEEQLKTAQQQVAAARKAEEFVEHRGALFKRKGGVYVEAVYCPKCHTSLGSLEPVMPFHCSPCRWVSSFRGSDLPEVMKTLPK